MSRWREGAIVAAVIAAVAGIVWIGVVSGIAPGPPQVNRGVITGHNHHPMWSQVMSTGKTTTIITHPERWELCYEGDTADGRHGRECRDVDAGTWQACDDGDWIDFVEHICRDNRVDGEKS